MYSIFRLLSLLALLSVIGGMMAKQMQWGSSTVFLVVGIVLACTGFGGRQYLDYKKRQAIKAGKQPLQ